ncbi:MAG: phosphopantothenoylcysteine decarboxylase [Rubrobacteraceae bacterium]|nr:phosphopantothenoylcysteine decarboxylase [Rubrobacteraceae bacterium]
MIQLHVGPGPGALEAPELCRRLLAAGHQVGLSLEPGATRFVGPLAFSGLAHDPAALPGPVAAVVHAPASAGTIARIAGGLTSPGEDAPLVIAPDLDPQSALHPAVRDNLSLLRGWGCAVVEGTGGRMAPVQEIARAVFGVIGGPRRGLKIMVSAGGTREPIDGVRYIGNRSSGKMGLAVAEEAVARGAEVTVVAANVAGGGSGWVPVETFGEIREEILRRAKEADALVMAAAVSDFTPAAPFPGKMKRKEKLTLELVATGDILREVRAGNPDLFVVGFAAIHGDPVDEAREKLLSKGADLVVGNDVSRDDIGFGADENEVYVVSAGREWFFPRAPKRRIAGAILDVMAEEMSKKGRKSNG